MADAQDDCSRLAVDWPPAFTVLPFPAARRVGKARQVARTLLEKPGKAGDDYWTRTVRAMAKEMKTAGISPSDAHRQMVDFLDLVKTEMSRARQRGEK